MSGTEARVALDVTYPGAENVIVDLDQGHDLNSIERSMAELFGYLESAPARLWQRTPQGMEPIGELNPRHPQPIGGLLNAGGLYRVELSAERPLLRGN